ncbi:Uncharacterised protein [Enterobacter cloacae]|nr:Uncharacterised protein [Enterobacter cloacae]
MDNRRKDDRKEGHDHQRLSGRFAGTLRIELTQAKRHHHRRTEIDSGKEGHHHHIETIRQPYPGHSFFTENRHSKGGDFTPEENSITFTFCIPGRAHNRLA